MVEKRAWPQAWIMFFIILANFIAQVPYFFHLYYGRQAAYVTFRSFLIMGAVFAFFLAASLLFFQRYRAGWWLMLVFLSVEFLFYLFNVINSARHGFGLFFQILNPDIILRIIYSLGYLNLFAAGYFIYLLLRYQVIFTKRSDMIEL